MLFKKLIQGLPVLLALITSALFQACEDDVSVTAKTYHVENVTSSSGTIRCTVTVEGDDLVDAGICYSATVTYPKITTSRCVPSTGSMTDFTTTLTGLSPDSTYRFRAYACLSDTTYYGITYSFRPVDMIIDMVDVIGGSFTAEGGSFTMGATSEQVAVADDDEKPAHSVTLSDFKIGRYEITTSQFVQFLNSRKLTSGGTCMTYSGSSFDMLEPNAKSIYYSTDDACWYPVSGYETHPMTNVTWYGANEFCRWAGGHLPTEAEWEYAARGGKSSAGYMYSGGNVSSDVAWYFATTNDQTGIEYFAQIGGGKSPNELGIYDMSGNVWEWCADWYATYPSAAQTDPAGLSDDEAEDADITKKVRRGGGWADTSVKKLRVSSRAANTPKSYAGSVGFRFAARD